MLVNFAEITTWCADVLRRCDLPGADADVAAGLLVRSEARGYASHGLTRLPSYVDRLASGAFKARPAMSHRSLPGGIVLDADDAMGHVAAPRAIALGLRALETDASVLVTVRSCGHMGALGVHALQAAEAGLLCVLGQAGPAVVGMEGFSGPGIGTNPLAFGCPIPGRAPLVFDMSSSVAARGRVLLALREKRPIPEGWAVDSQGRPTTDPEAAMEGSLLPAGGHKGIGIAMLVHCLAAGLAGSAQSLAEMAQPVPASGAPGGMCAFLWMVRPHAFASESDFAEQMLGWTDHYLSCGEAARLPGARGAEMEARYRVDGLPLDGVLLKALRELGDRLSVPFPAGA